MRRSALAHGGALVVTSALAAFACACSSGSSGGGGATPDDAGDAAVRDGGGGLADATTPDSAAHDGAASDGGGPGDAGTTDGDAAVGDGGWELVWSDEFDEDAGVPDPSNWTFTSLNTTTSGPGWGVEYDEPAAVQVSGGLLTITATRPPPR